MNIQAYNRMNTDKRFSCNWYLLIYEINENFTAYLTIFIPGWPDSTISPFLEVYLFSIYTTIKVVIVNNCAFL